MYPFERGGALAERLLRAAIALLGQLFVFCSSASAFTFLAAARVCMASVASSANWQYESAVGSALPVLTTLRDILETGDTVHAIRGCVSGTMAYGQMMVVVGRDPGLRWDGLLVHF